MEHVVDSSVRYRLSEVIGALSHALDLTEGQPVGHSQRSCMIGMELAARPDGLEGEAIPLISRIACLAQTAKVFMSVDGPEVDAKSPYTARHSLGVATYAVAIGEHQGFDAVRLRSLRRAGLLHDIGKLGVSN